MTEQRFEKVVEWEGTPYIFRHTFIAMGLTFVFYCFIFPIILLEKFPELKGVFFPIGWIWIFYAIISALTIRNFYKKKVYWRKIK